MKLSYFLVPLVVILTGYNSYAQNTFPASGNVGIGTISPTFGLLLHLNGSNPDFLSMNQTNPTQPVQFNAYNNIDFRIVQRSNAAITLWTNTLERMRIDQNGNVGIGTPNGLLHVNGMSVFAGNSSNLDNRNNNINLNFLANSGQMVLGWNRTQASGEIDFIANQGAGPIGGFAFYNHDNNNSESQLLCIQGNGNVAIGTLDPRGYKLAVNGGVIATAVTVKLYASWPDYVFKKDYRLPSLAEVKAYIDQNQHLPEIPSAAEIAKDGLNLGEINKLLMKKV